MKKYLPDFLFVGWRNLESKGKYKQKKYLPNLLFVGQRNLKKKKGEYKRKILWFCFCSTEKPKEKEVSWLFFLSAKKQSLKLIDLTLSIKVYGNTSTIMITWTQIILTRGISGLVIGTRSGTTGWTWMVRYLG